MFFRMVYDDKLAQAAYVIGCQKTGEAIVIDPQRDVDRYEEIAAANGLRLTAAAETHIHADFVSGARELAEKGATVYLSDEGDADWKYQWPALTPVNRALKKYNVRLLKDGDRFSIGNVEFKAVHTPGHTPEHMAFMVTDRGGGADEPLGVATGDFVFVGDVGRPDLLESAAGFAGKADASARRLYQSVRAFTHWPDYLQLWPGHGAGSACGKALGAVPQSTVGYEKRFNTAVKNAASENAFVSEVLAGQPEPPLYFARMKRDNKMGPRVLGGVPHPREITLNELKAIDANTAAIIDTRPWPDFRAGHLPGALSFPLTKSFSTDAGSMIREGEPVYLIIDAARLEEAVRDLMHVGIENVRGWFDTAGMPDCQRICGTIETTREIPAEEACTRVAAGELFVLDVRRASEYAEGHIDGATNIAHTRLLARLSDLPRSRPILVHCRSGVRSARASALLQRNGFNVTNLAGGFLAWEQAASPR